MLEKGIERIEECSPENRVHLKSQNVALVRNRVFTHIIHSGSHEEIFLVLGWALNPSTDIFIRKGDTGRYTEISYAATSQGTPDEG